MNDPYRVLNLPRDADPAAIKRAYRALAKRLHPDRNPGDPEAERRFKDITQAYQ
ncbi:MAG: DnaJ domain-containing protein, partial [Geminicoccaceae bacterium]